MKVLVETKEVEKEFLAAIQELNPGYQSEKKFETKQYDSFASVYPRRYQYH